MNRNRSKSRYYQGQATRTLTVSPETRGSSHGNTVSDDSQDSELPVTPEHSIIRTESGKVSTFLYKVFKSFEAFQLLDDHIVKFVPKIQMSLSHSLCPIDNPLAKSKKNKCHHEGRIRPYQALGKALKGKSTL